MKCLAALKSMWLRSPKEALATATLPNSLIKSSYLYMSQNFGKAQDLPGSATAASWNLQPAHLRACVCKTRAHGSPAAQRLGSRELLVIPNRQPLHALVCCVCLFTCFELQPLREAELPRSAYRYLSAKHHNPEATIWDNRQRNWRATRTGDQDLAMSHAAVQQPASRRMAIKFHYKVSCHKLPAHLILASRRASRLACVCSRMCRRSTHSSRAASTWAL